MKVRDFGKTDAFGYMSVFSQEPRRNTVIATHRCELARMTCAMVERVLGSSVDGALLKTGSNSKNCDIQRYETATT